MKKINKKNIVAKSNTLINSLYSLTLQEQRLIILVISMINSSCDKEFQPFQITVDSFCKIIGLKRNAYYSELGAVCQKIMQRVITISRKDGGWDKLHWLSRCSYLADQGMIEVTISSDLKPHLLNLKSHYTSFLLQNILPLKSTYSIRFYELLKQYEKLKERYFELDELRRILQIDEDKYSIYSHFKQRVISKAQKDLEDSTDISFTIKERKERRKVIGIHFFIRSNNVNVIDMAMVNGKAISEKEIIETLNVELYKNLTDLGISNDKAKSLLNKYDENRLTQNVEYIRFKINEGKIRDIAAYAISAIEQDWKLQTTIDDYISKQKTDKAAAAQEAKRLKPGTMVEIEGHQYTINENMCITNTDWVNPTMDAGYIETLITTGKAKVIH